MRTRPLPVSRSCWSTMCRWLLLVVVQTVSPACTHFGPGTRQKDRLGYVNVYANDRCTLRRRQAWNT